MPFDNFMLGGVVKELQSHRSAKVNKISQPDRYTIVMRLHSTPNIRLLLSAHPQEARLHISSAEVSNPPKAPVFCMVLRKYLENARLLDIWQVPDERIAIMRFSYINELGDEDECRLIIEMMGKHSNIILVNHEGIIIDGIRRYTHAVSRYRQVLPNEEYISPPPQDKISIHALDTESLYALLMDSEEQSPEKAMLKAIGGISPFSVRDMLKRARLDGMKVDDMGLYEAESLMQAISQYTVPQYKPCILLQDGKPKDIYCLQPEAWNEAQLLQLASINEACDRFYSERRATDSFDAQKRELVKVIRNFTDKLGRKLKAQTEELQTAQSGDSWKEKGDLLAANLWQVQKGMLSITLDNFYAENEPITIDLLPELSPQENLSRFYRRYNKLKSASKEIIKQLESTKSEYEYLLSVESAAENALIAADLEQIKEELADGGYLRAQKKKQQKQESLLPPLEFTSSDGFTILVGRNNKQNDRLTLKIADKNDIWLHTQKIPGSHVIIRCGGRPVPDQTLLEAASLAVTHSKASGGGKTPVDYTEVSQVKKPSGAKPGMVIYFKQQTVMAEAVK